MGKAGLLDLEKHFAFYGAYHNNPVNIFIHTLFVWPILFSALVLFYFSPTVFVLPLAGGFLPSVLRPALIVNFGSFLAVFYALFYVALDTKAGSLGALLCLICWVGACSLAPWLGWSLAWKLLCWTGQFIGHGVFEKRAPALLDNLVQAFLMAPFFVLLEVLQTCFRYEPYPGFHASVTAKIQEEIKEWKEKNQKKSS